MLGEEYARKCLEIKGFDVIDRTQNKDYWKIDVDFTAIKSNFSFDIEVKYDTKISKSGNLYLELLTDIQDNKFGWV